MDAYSVSATLRLNDQLLGGLRQIVEMLRTAQGEVRELQQSLDRLGVGSARAGVGTLGAANSSARRSRGTGDAESERDYLRSVQLRSGLMTGSEAMRKVIAEERAREKAAKAAYDLQKEQLEARAAAERKYNQEQEREIQKQTRLRLQGERRVLGVKMRFFQQEEREHQKALRANEAMLTKIDKANFAAYQKKQRAEEAAEKKRIREEAQAAREASAARAGIAGAIAGHELTRSIRRGAGFGIGGALVYGGYEAMRLDDVIAQLQYTTGGHMTPQQQRRAGFTIMDIAGATGIGLRQAEEMAPQAFRVMGNNISVEQRLKLMKMLSPLAVAEGRITGQTPKEALLSFVEMMHMVGRYYPSEIMKTSGEMAAAGTMTQFGLHGIVTGASYALQALHAQGVSPETTMALIAAFERAGTRPSRAGTNLLAMLTQLGKTGSLAAMVSTKGGKLKAEALFELGMIGRHGEAIGLHLLQQNRVGEFAEVLQSHLLALPADQRGNVMYQAFGTRGMREMAGFITPHFTEQVSAASKAIASARPEDFIKATEKYFSNPMMQLDRTMSNLQITVLELGSHFISPLTTALGGINHVLTGVNEWLRGHPQAAGGIAYAAGGVAGLAGLSLLTRSLTGLIAPLTKLGGLNIAGVGTGLAGVATGIAAISAGLGASKWWLEKTDKERAAEFDAVFGKGMWKRVEDAIGKITDPVVRAAVGHAFPLPEPSDKVKQRIQDETGKRVPLPAHGAPGKGASLAPSYFFGAVEEDHPSAARAARNTGLLIAEAAGAALASEAKTSARMTGEAIAKATAATLRGIDFGPIGAAIAQAVEAAFANPELTGGIPGSSIPLGGGLLGASLLGRGGAALPHFGGGSTAMPGADVMSTLGMYAQYLMSKGVDRAHAAAILASIYPESHGAPGSIGDHGTSIGLFQEHGSRASALVAALGPGWAKNWKGQIDFALGEMHKIDPAWFSHTGAGPLGAEWSREFERPADKVGETFTRVRLAQLFAAKLIGAPPPSRSAPAAHDADSDAIGGAIAKAVTAHLEKMNVQIADAGGTGDVHLDGEKVGAILSRHIERGIARATSSGVARAGARPDHRGGPALTPPI